MRTRLARDVAVVVAVHLAVACAIGLLLPHLAELSQATRTAEGVVTSEVEVGKQFNDDGWLVVLGGLAGLVLGLVLTVWRSTHEVVTVVAIAVAGVLGALLAGWLAQATGPGDPVRVLAEAEVGATAPMAVSIDARVAYLVWPLMGVLSALVALLWPPGDARSPQGNRGDLPPV